MTDNNELYEVIGSILKEFKVEVEESIEEQRLISNGFALDNAKHNATTEDTLKELENVIVSNDKARQKTIDDFTDVTDKAVSRTSEFKRTLKESTDLLAKGILALTEREANNTIATDLRMDESEKLINDLSKDNKSDLDKQSNDIIKTIEAITESVDDLSKDVSRIAKRSVDDRNAVDIRHDNLSKTTNDRIEKLNESLEKQFTDSVEISESIKKELDKYCKEKLNSQYAALRKDYVELHNNLNESFKNVPSNKELVEFIATQDEITDSLREELAIQKQDNINLLAETKAYIDEIVPSLKGDTGSLERVIAWQKDYPREINQVVTHNNCLWQLKYEDSNESPCDSDDWRLLIAGLTDIKISPDKENKVSVVMTDGSDKQYDCEIVLPIPNMLDTWDEHKEYKFYDNVKKDGCRWITQKDNPQGKPGESKDWHIDSLPAQRGRKGEKGDKGEVGSIGISGHTPTKQEMITVMNEDR